MSAPRRIALRCRHPQFAVAHSLPLRRVHRRRSVLLAQRTSRPPIHKLSPQPLKQEEEARDDDDLDNDKENADAHNTSTAPPSRPFHPPASVKRPHALLSTKKVTEQVSFSSSSSAPRASPSSPSARPSAAAAAPSRYLRCLYAARSSKKHKTYSDGVLHVQGRMCALYSEDSKVVVRRLATAGTAAWDDGVVVELGNWELELCATLTEDDFLTGRCFTAEPTAADAQHSAPTSTSAAPLKPFTPLHRRQRSSSASSVTSSPSKARASAAPSTQFGLYDLSDPSLLVLNRADLQPASSSVASMRGAPAAVPVVVEAILSRALRPHQEVGVQFLYDCLIGKSNPPHTGAILADDMGLGKCFAAGTMLRLYDGHTIAVEHIGGGELLMGDDSTPRIVTPGSLSRGRGAMYRITPSHDCAMPFTVNGDHILVLTNTVKPYMLWDDTSSTWAVCWFDLSTSNDMTCHLQRYDSHEAAQAELTSRLCCWQPLEWEVSVDHFLEAPESVRDACQLFRSGPVTFHWPEALSLQHALHNLLRAPPTPSQLEWAAWFLGLWTVRGDRHARSVSVTLPAHRSLHELKERLLLYSGLFEQPVRTKDIAGSSAGASLGIVRFFVGSAVVRLLNRYGVLLRRHIPRSWVCDSIAMRRGILAGILDGRGCQGASGCVDVTVTHLDLAEGCRLLASTLGVGSSAVSTLVGEDVTAHHIVLSGGLREVLGLCAMKWATDPLANGSDDSARPFGFTIRPAGVEEYYGFAVSGSNRRFLLADFTVTHNTLQSIAVLHTLLRGGPAGVSVVRKCVVVCPSTLLGNWQGEFCKWLGKERLRVVSLDASRGREEQQRDVQAFVTGNANHVLIISYELFRKHVERLRPLRDALLICDEGHRLKNSKGNRTIAALQSVASKRRLILTGTPVQNDLLEFFAMCDFVNPTFLGSLQSFRHNFETPISRSREVSASAAEKALGEARSRELSRRTSLFVLRRGADILRRYLPPKHELVLFCRMAELQRAVYVEVLKSKPLRKAVDSELKALALTCIQTLTQIVNHPALVYQQCKDTGEHEGSELSGVYKCYPEHYDEHSASREDESGKMAVLMALLAGIRAEGGKVVVVSNYVKTLDIIEALCKARSWPILRLDGGTATERRQELVDRFNSPYNVSHDVFLLSAKAGGLGLNLIGGNRLIVYDPDWNPATDLQAMARIWRDGQPQAVHVYRLLALGSIDEKIFQRQLRKQEVASAVMDDKRAEAAAGTRGREVGGAVRVFDSKSLREIFKYSGQSDCETYEVLSRKHGNHYDESGGGGRQVKHGKDVVVGRRKWQCAWDSGESDDVLVQRLRPGAVSCVWSRLSKADDEDEAPLGSDDTQLTEEEAEEQELLAKLTSTEPEQIPAHERAHKQQTEESDDEEDEDEEELEREAEAAVTKQGVAVQDEVEDNEQAELEEEEDELLLDELEARRQKAEDNKARRRKKQADVAAQMAAELDEIEQEQEQADEVVAQAAPHRAEKRRRLVEDDSDEDEFLKGESARPLPPADASAERPM